VERRKSSKKVSVVDSKVVNDCLYEFFAEVDREKYKTPSQVIHSILRKLNELIYNDPEKDSVKL
jgi:Cdc6-like AAA superfamily ATPase